MYIDQNEILRVRVEADEFWDDEPGPPKADSGVQVRRERARAPFSLIVSPLRNVREMMIPDVMGSARWLNRDLARFLGGSQQKRKGILWRKNEHFVGGPLRADFFSMQPSYDLQAEQ